MTTPVPMPLTRAGRRRRPAGAAGGATVFSPRMFTTDGGTRWTALTIGVCRNSEPASRGGQQQRHTPPGPSQETSRATQSTLCRSVGHGRKSMVWEQSALAACPAGATVAGPLWPALAP